MYTKTNILLSAKNVGLSYIDRHTKQEKVIIQDANMEIRDIIGDTAPTGQVVSLVGKSGEGKSTLLRMLSGLEMPYSKRTGEILIHHDRATKDGNLIGDHNLGPVNEGDMGIVFQNYYMPEHLTIRKMLMKSAKKNPDFKSQKEMSDAVDWYIEQFELSEHKNKYPCELSGGQKQRSAIILQLVNGSNFLLLDEPFSGLDPLMIDKTTKFLQKAANSDELKTLIIVSHDLVNCAAISDSIFVLSKKGRPEGTGATIVANIDLLSMGLAYHTEIKRMPEFHNVIDTVKGLL